MKKKILITCSLILILVFGFLYTQKNILIADDKDGKDSKKDCSSQCNHKSSSTENKINNSEQNINGASISDGHDNKAVYEFVTDKIHCDGCKTEMSGKLMEIPGVKEISYGETSSSSHLTGVKIYYSSADTNPEVIAASVKEKGLTCTKDKCCDGSKCTTKNKTEKKL